LDPVVTAKVEQTMITTDWCHILWF